MVGQSISHYKLVSQLGESGRRVVYKAEDTKLERTVAPKFLAAHLLNDTWSRRSLTFSRSLRREPLP